MRDLGSTEPAPREFPQYHLKCLKCGEHPVLVDEAASTEQSPRCHHEESLYGRCTACVMTWAEQSSGRTADSGETDSNRPTDRTEPRRHVLPDARHADWCDVFRGLDPCNCRAATEQLHPDPPDLSGDEYDFLHDFFTDSIENKRAHGGNTSWLESLQAKVLGWRAAGSLLDPAEEGQ